MRSPDSDVVLLSRALGFGSGWLLLGVAGAVAKSFDMPASDAFWSVRVVHHVVDFGRHAAAALLTFTAVLAWGHWVTRGATGLLARGKAVAATFAVSLVLSITLVAEDVAGMAQRSSESMGLPPELLHGLITAAIALGVPAIGLLGTPFRRGPWRLIPIVACVATFWLNATTSPRDNFGLHFFLSWSGATLLGVSLAWPEVWVRAIVRRPARTHIGLAALGVLGLVGVGLPLTNSQRIDLALWDTNLLPEVSMGRAGSKTRSTSARGNSFFAPREHAPSVEPRPHALLADDGVVLLLCIDGVRADVLVPEHRERFPNLFRLFEGGTRFTNARSPGSATVYTLSALSTGLPFAARYWSKTKGDYWPFEDDAVHFPALLSDAGVSTLHARSTSWLENERRLMSGFRSEVYPKKDWKWAKGKDLADALIAMLQANPSGPLFAFTHFLDTHHPYLVGRKESKEPFEQYLHALSYVDRQLGRILRTLDELDMTRRAVVIATADHGEAFGEHGTHHHATTLYEEQVRVPLIFWGPTIPPQERTEFVTLVDLGPTILELFGQPTPAAFLGQSLVPALERKPITFERPVFAEARLLQSLVFEDGTKVIRDRKSQIVEVYDLNVDPGERRNLSDEDAAKFGPRVDRLVEFFEAHAEKRPGYRIPLRK